MEAPLATDEEVTGEGAHSSFHAQVLHPSSESATPWSAELSKLFELHAEGLVRGLVAAGYQESTDSVQDAFVQALIHWRRISRYDDPVAWLRRVAINKARNRSRSRRREAAAKNRLTRVVSPVVREMPDDDVGAALTQLPAQQREVIALFYYSDIPIHQIAEIMKISEGTVKSHLHRARSSIARLLEGTT
jgi:RNA polymerase sigma-70 factor (ECF subfamily)